VLEVVVVSARVPGGQVLALPVTGALLDFGEHDWEWPKPLGLHLHKHEEEFGSLLLRLEQTNACYKDSPRHTSQKAENAALNPPSLRPKLDQLEHLLKFLLTWNE